MTRKHYFGPLTIIIMIVLFVLSSCGGAKKAEIPKGAEFIDDFQGVPKLTSNQVSENQRIIDEYNKRKKIIVETRKEDIKQKAELQAKKEQIEAEQHEFEKLIEEKVQNEEIREMIANAKDADELEKILREKTNLTESEIQQIVKKKVALVKKDKNLRLDALGKIYNRLVRNQQLGIEPSFCDAATSLDNFVINPIYYDTDVYAIGKNDANSLFNSVEKIVDVIDSYPKMVLQLEGNCDERGSNVYNKNLGDYRWTGAVPLLVSMQFSKNRIRGISKGEECAIERDSNVNDEAWWQKNRRTDFTWVLK